MIGPWQRLCIVVLMSIEASVGVRHSPIRPSLPLPSDKCTEVLNKSIRHFSKKEVHIKKNYVLGSGVFGKCFGSSWSF